MDYFDDFTLYSYMHYENAVNIGWDTGGTLPGPAVGEDFRDLLPRYLAHRVNMTRGGGILKQFIYEGKSYTLGCAELRVLGKDGTVFAVPDMVVDLVMRGEYCPPEALTDAVVHGIEPDSAQYRAYIKTYDQAHFWGAGEEYARKGNEALHWVLTGSEVTLSRFLEDEPGAMSIVTSEGSLLNAAIRHNLERNAMLLLDLEIPINRYNGGELFSAIDAKMDAVALRLIDEGIPLHTQSPQCNPLFYAIAKGSNTVAKKLADCHKQLFQIYNTPFVRNCNILQWCVKCRNTEMLAYITEASRY